MNVGDRENKMDYEIMTISDLLSNELDNVSQDQLDDEMKLFKLYAKKLGIRDYNDFTWINVLSFYQVLYLCCHRRGLSCASASH